MMSNQMKDLSIQIKNNIIQLIEKKEYSKADQLINQYMEIAKEDIEVFSIKAINFLEQDMLEEAENALVAGLTIDKNNFDLLYNLGYLFELKKDREVSWRYYLKAKAIVSNHIQEKLIQECLKRLEIINENKEDRDLIKFNQCKKKLVFLVKPGMDSFLGGIIKELSRDFEVRKVIIKDLGQLEAEMLWADVCWFEWCDELIAYGSNMKLAQEKVIICRIHGYEVYSDYIIKPNWLNVNQIVIVAPHILRIFNKKVDSLVLKNTKVDLVYCGVDLSLYPFKKRVKGFNIGYLGYLNFKKNIPLTLDIFYQLYKLDNRYKLFLAGEFQDERTLSYLKFFVNEYQLQNHVIYDGWQSQEQKNRWFDKINYMLISSIDEGLCYAAAESMAVGIKPILHNCEGLKDHYPDKYRFRTNEEAVKMITEDNYLSEEYRKYIEKHYSANIESDRIKNIITDLLVLQNRISKKKEDYDKKKYPLVTIGIINYNQEKYLEECFESIIAQDYPNKEILIIDDCSTDGSMEIIRRYLAKHDNIKLTQHKQNSGSGSKGPQDTQLYAKGKYFTYIDADDYYADNDIISTFVEVLEQNEKTDFVYGCFKLVDKNGNEIDQWKYKQFDQQEIVKGVFDRLGSGLMPMIGLYRNSFYQKNKLTMYYDSKLKIGCDTLNSLINIKYGWNYSYIDKTVLCYRRHESNVTSQIEKRIICTIILAEYIANNFPENWYLPEIRWHEVKERKFKRAVKSFYLGHYFFQAFTRFAQSYATMKVERLLDILSPFVSKMEEYFADSLKDRDIFKEDIAKINEEYRGFVERLKSKEADSVDSKETLPKVSIVIPTYNRKGMLKDAVDSALAQTYPNLEIIVTDNASTDGTYELMQEYNNDHRIQYVRHDKNMGADYNFWNGYTNLATGDYFLLLHDDDYLIDDYYISKVISLINQDENIVLVHANCNMINMANGEIQSTNFQTERILSGLEYFFNYETEKYPHVTGFVTTIMRRDIIVQMTKTLGSESTMLGVDLIMYLFCMLWKNSKIGVISDYAGMYRIHGENDSNSLGGRNLTGKNKDGTVEALEKMAELAKKQGISEKLVAEWLQFRLWKFVNWCCGILFSTGQVSRGVEFLESLQAKYPLVIRNIKARYNISV